MSRYLNALPTEHGVTCPLPIEKVDLVSFVMLLVPTACTSLKEKHFFELIFIDLRPKNSSVFLVRKFIPAFELTSRMISTAKPKALILQPPISTPM